MKRALIVTIAAGGLLFGGMTAAHADPPFDGDGVNGDHPAWFGLCNAYAHNSDQGKANGKPFQALTAELAENAEFCDGRTPGNSGNARGGR